MSPRKQLVQPLSIYWPRPCHREPKAWALPKLHPDPEHRYEPFPLSDVQQACLIERSQSVELGDAGCQHYFEVELEDWAGERFQTALQKLIERHEMLRAVIHRQGPQQILGHVGPYELEIQDLRGLSRSLSQAKLEAIRGEMAANVHATDRWSLFEFRASLLDSGRARLHVRINLLISDSRSFEIIFDELNQLYRDPGVLLPEIELSFRDYMLASEAFENSHAFRESKEYWMSRLPTLPPAPQLPLAFSPSSIVQPKFCRRQARLDPATWRILQEKTARIGLSAPGILLAVYAEVLAIWSKSPHFTLNLTLVSRLPLHPQVNHVVGNFTTVNLLEVDNSRPQRFEKRALLQQQQLWQDFDHLHFSGVRVIRELTRMQGVGLKAIMPVVFTSLLTIGADSEEQSLVARLGEPVYSASQTPEVFLDLLAHEDCGSLVMDWFVADEVFPENLIDDLFKAFQTLLEHLVSDESAWTRTLAENSQKLLPAYQMSLLKGVNNTTATRSKELLHTLFLRQVEKRPDQLAVYTQIRQLTYADVYSRACGIEQELLARGLNPNQFVGIVMEKGWEQIVAAMGILFAGGAYVPIDPEFPPERQRYLIENGNVKVVLTQSSVQHRVRVPDNVEILAVDHMQPLEGRPTRAARTRQKQKDFAYMIYTSGSTGQPKGVVVDHHGAVNTIVDINERYGVGPEDRILALSRLNFDLSVYDIFGLLAAGGTIVMPTAKLALDTRHWARLVAREKVTLWNTVPALMGLLVDQVEHSEPIGQSLRVILMSGDWIPIGLPGRIRKLLPKATLVSLGGATEASIWSILYPIETVDTKWKSIPYGKPMRNQTVHVLSRVGTPCPLWVPGQLHIGGVGLAIGYWRDAEKTAASFAYHKLTGERLYLTGDWGRYIPDGNIEFLGREDSQVKVQGYRIELGEIESELIRHEGIDRCIVLVREDTPGAKRLVGYIIQKPGADLQVAGLREYLRAKLPEYMVPSTFMFLGEFPLTMNGKVDRKRLPAPVRA